MPYTIEGKEVIVLGDTTTHGGKVITASETHSYMGVPVARVGDIVECPKCKGAYPIVEGAPKTFDHGKSIARHGDKVACGATLISRANMADPGTLYADIGNIITDAGAAPASKRAAPLHETGQQCDKPEFFALYNEFKLIADEYDTDVYFLMAQAARESGWAIGVKNYNLFGVNKTPAELKKDPPYQGEDKKWYGTNRVYESFQYSLQSWLKNFGESIRGTKTINDYINALQSRKPPYNPRGNEYVEEVLANYCSVLARLQSCGLPPEVPKFSKDSNYACSGRQLIKTTSKK
jgi:uncharacterized Zn-binding protein involved in type VI secretion